MRLSGEGKSQAEVARRCGVMPVCSDAASGGPPAPPRNTSIIGGMVI